MEKPSESQYFVCEWKIIRINVSILNKVLDSASGNDFDLGLTFPKKANTGFWVIPFFARVRSESALNRFVEEVRIEMDLSDWHLATPVETQRAMFDVWTVDGKAHIIETCWAFAHTNASLSDCT